MFSNVTFRLFLPATGCAEIIVFSAAVLKTELIVLRINQDSELFLPAELPHLKIVILRLFLPAGGCAVLKTTIIVLRINCAAGGALIVSVLVVLVLKTERIVLRINCAVAAGALIVSVLLLLC